MTQKYCPKCKKPVDANAIRCPHCNMRLKVICPTCNTANLFGLDSCTNCGTALLKYCENCGSANFSDAKECRKCHSSFTEEVLTFEKNRSKLFSTPSVAPDGKHFVDAKSAPQEVKEPLVAPVEQVETVVTVEPAVDENLPVQKQEEVPETVETVVSEEPDDVEVIDDVDVVQDDNQDFETDDENVEYVEEYEYVEEEVPQDEMTDFVDDGYPDDGVVIDDAEFEEIPEEVEEVDENNEVITDEEEPVEDVDNEEFEEIESEEELKNVEKQEDVPGISVDELIAQSESKAEEIEVDENQDIVFFDDAQPLLEQLSNIIQTENNAVIAAVCAEEGMGIKTLGNRK